jgi:hypothetical protein
MGKLWYLTSHLLWKIDTALSKVQQQKTWESPVHCQASSSTTSASDS